MTRLHCIAISLLSMTCVSPAALAQTSIRTLENPPLPVFRDQQANRAPGDASADGSAAVVPPSTFRAIAPLSKTGANRLVQRSNLKDGLDALSDRKTALARQLRDGMPDNSLDRHILQWAIALSGLADVPFEDIQTAQQDLVSWPGMDLVRRNAERALFRQKLDADQVIRALGGRKIQSAEGAMALAKAHLDNGDRKAAAAAVAPVWREERLTRSLESAILTRFDDLLTQADHRYRMERLLYNDRIEAADRVASKAGAQALHKAWSAVIRGNDKADALLEAVPENQRSAGYWFAKALRLRKKDEFLAAFQAMRQAPTEQAELIDPDEWWIERRILSRDLLERGEIRKAYDLAAGHSARAPRWVAEAEFHAGWYALRFLDDPKLAKPHFDALATVATAPMTTARAHYWAGRSLEAGAGQGADDRYALAAQHPETFYGQLAAAKLGKKELDVTYAGATPNQQQRFFARESVQAIARLQESGADKRADILYRALANELTSPGELTILAEMAERERSHALALYIGKTAHGRGLDVAALAFPIGVIPSSADIDRSGKALAYAIARQESAFNPTAVSPAGARGLLQLLPGTAKEVARRNQMAYSRDRLTSDPGYNATLGAFFLGQQIEDFGGSYVLTFIAYNAGPGRAKQWIKRFGDPRGKKLEEVIDWVEQIPFSETRHYVQLILENYQVYKARLGNNTLTIEEDLRFGRS